MKTIAINPPRQLFCPTSEGRVIDLYKDSKPYSIEAKSDKAKDILEGLAKHHKWNLVELLGMSTTELSVRLHCSEHILKQLIDEVKNEKIKS